MTSGVFAARALCVLTKQGPRAVNRVLPGRDLMFPQLATSSADVTTLEVWVDVQQLVLPPCLSDRPTTPAAVKNATSSSKFEGWPQPKAQETIRDTVHLPETAVDPYHGWVEALVPWPLFAVDSSRVFGRVWVQQGPGVVGHREQLCFLCGDDWPELVPSSASTHGSIFWEVMVCASSCCCHELGRLPLCFH